MKSRNISPETKSLIADRVSDYSSNYCFPIHFHKSKKLLYKFFHNHLSRVSLASTIWSLKIHLDRFSEIFPLDSTLFLSFSVHSIRKLFVIVSAVIARAFQCTESFSEPPWITAKQRIIFQWIQLTLPHQIKMETTPKEIQQKSPEITLILFSLFFSFIAMIVPPKDEKKYKTFRRIYLKISNGNLL